MSNYIGDKYEPGRDETFIKPTKEILGYNSLYFL